MGPRGLGDDDLMVRYAAGDGRAFPELFRRHAQKLHALMRRHIRVGADAEDLVQQTFLQLHRARRDFRAGMRLQPWLMTIAMNVARDHLRRRRRRPEAPLVGDLYAAPVPEPGPDARLLGRLHAALHQLPRLQREVIELHCLEERPYEQLARRFGANASTLRVRAHRGYRALRRALA